MQLEDDFLEHDGATLTLTHYHGRPLYMGIIFITIPLRDIYALPDPPARHLKAACKPDRRASASVASYRYNRQLFGPGRPQRFNPGTHS
jgi:hypothetical protein